MSNHPLNEEERIRAFIADKMNAPAPPDLEMKVRNRLRRRRLLAPFFTGTLIAAAATGVAIVALSLHANRIANSIPAQSLPVNDASPTPSPPSTSTWVDFSNPAGAYSFRHPASWQVSGPCVDHEGFPGSAGQQVMVGPGATGCGQPAGAHGISIESGPAYTAFFPAAGQYPNCPQTYATVVIAGVTGTRHSIDNCSSSGTNVHIIEYSFIAVKGRDYRIVFQGTVAPEIPINTVDLLVTTFRVPA